MDPEVLCTGMRIPRRRIFYTAGRAFTDKSYAERDLSGTVYGKSYRRGGACMNYREAMAYVEELGKYGSVMGLTTMQELCASL